MNLEKILNFVRTNFKLTKSEIIVAFLLFIGFSIGFLLRFNEKSTTEDKLIEEIYFMLDSVSKTEVEKNLGTDFQGNTVDTSVRQPIFNKVEFERFRKLTDTDAVKININTASRVELMRLPGVGEKTAQQIIDLREKKQLKKPEDLLVIKGFGKKKLERIRQYIDF